MIDIKKEITALLKECCPDIKVTYSRPKEIKTLPLITWVEDNNREVDEYIDEITISIDIWDTSFLNCEKTAMAINKAMREKGFKRGSKIPLGESEVQRINMRFYGYIDQNKFISKGAY